MTGDFASAQFAGTLHHDGVQRGLIRARVVTRTHGDFAKAFARIKRASGSIVGRDLEESILCPGSTGCAWHFYRCSGTTMSGERMACR